jgi:hypothetical protein
MVCPPWQLPYHSLTTCSGNKIYSLHVLDLVILQIPDMLLKISSVKSDHPTRHIALYSKHALLIGHHDLFKSLTSVSSMLLYSFLYS